MTEKKFRISQGALEIMEERCVADYPEETCGFVFATASGSFDVVPMENIQNRLHAEDPETWSRDARTAYYFDPGEMQRVLEERERLGQAFCSIYHSHPEHDAYFSETDSQAAAVFGEPNFPGVTYLVFSVREGRVVDRKGFDWSAESASFVEVPLEILRD